MEEPEGTVTPGARRDTSASLGPGETGDPPARPVGELVDATLLEEITLLSEVIATLAGYSGRLDDGEVDDVVGLTGVREPVRGRVQASRPRSRFA